MGFEPDAVVVDDADDRDRNVDPACSAYTVKKRKIVPF